DALVDLGRRRETERKPSGPGLTAEVRARDERDSGGGRPAEQLARVGVRRQFEPEEVAALWPRPASLPTELALESGEHCIAPFPQQPSHPLEVRLQQASAKEFEHCRLGNERR